MGTLNLKSDVNLAVRDFDGLKQAFQEYASANFSDIWTDFNDSSFANAISEIIAYLGDNLHFYLDRQTQDCFLATTQDRQAAIDLAALVAYRPFNARPATGQITLTLDTGTFNYLNPIGKGFQVSNGADIIFETINTVTVPGGSTSITLDVIEGKTIRQTTVGQGVLAVADGSPYQAYILGEPYVLLSRTIEDINDNEDLLITVNGVQYTATETLSTAQSTDKVFTIQTNDDNETIITFGNGEFGIIPAEGFLIEATYRVLTDADTRLQQSNGNASAGAVTTILTQRTGVEACTNASAMTGGGPQETLEEIKINAPASLSALNRAVALKDFATLAKDVTGVAKSVATPSEDPLDVLLYIAPNGGGYPSPALKAAVVDSFFDKKMAKTTVFARDPVYQDVAITLRVFIQETNKASTVLNDISSAISSLFSFENMDFGRRVLLKSTSTNYDNYDFYETLESITGIERLEIQKFTLKPVIYEKVVDNSGSMAMTRRGTTVRSNSGRYEYRLVMDTLDQYYLEKALVGQSTTLNDTTISDETIDLTLASGTSTDNGALFLQDSNKTFAPNEFAGQSLIDSTGTIFLISSNTDDTITVSSGAPFSGNYVVVKRLIGKLLQPNTKKSDMFRIISNGINTITVSGGLGNVAAPRDEYRVVDVETNLYTEQFVSGKEDPVEAIVTSSTFVSGVLQDVTASALAGLYANDVFAGYQLVITTGDASNLRATVVNYVGATGKFVLSTPGSIGVDPTAGDKFVCAPKFYAGQDVAINGPFPPTATQFDSSSLAAPANDFYKGWKVRFTSGTHSGQVRRVNASASGSGRLTIDALPSAPAIGDQFEISRDYEDNERSIAFSVVRDTAVLSGDEFFFATSDLAGDLIPGTTQILQVSSSDVVLTSVGGST